MNCSITVCFSSIRGHIRHIEREGECRLYVFHSVTICRAFSGVVFSLLFRTHVLSPGLSSSSHCAHTMVHFHIQGVLALLGVYSQRDSLSMLYWCGGQFVMDIFVTGLGGVCVCACMCVRAHAHVCILRTSTPEVISSTDQFWFQIALKSHITLHHNLHCISIALLKRLMACHLSLGGAARVHAHRM